MAQSTTTGKLQWYGAPLPAPNPQRVRVFLNEKGIVVPEVTVNLLTREHKKLGDKNPAQQVPILELENGQTISESVAICRYFEEEYPEKLPRLFGNTAYEKATIDQWIRRVEFVFMMPLGIYWVHAHPYTKGLGIKRFPDFGEANKSQVIRAMAWFDEHMVGDYLVGPNFSMADIALLSSIDFAGFLDIPIPEECKRLTNWKSLMNSRQSANL